MRSPRSGSANWPCRRPPRWSGGRSETLLRRGLERFGGLAERGGDGGKRGLDRLAPVGAEACVVQAAVDFRLRVSAHSGGESRQKYADPLGRRCVYMLPVLASLAVVESVRAGMRRGAQPGGRRRVAGDDPVDVAGALDGDEAVGDIRLDQRRVAGHRVAETAAAAAPQADRLAELGAVNRALADVVRRRPGAEPDIAAGRAGMAAARAPGGKALAVLAAHHHDRARVADF